MEKERKSPQEKKAHSLVRDRRNTYGNNQKAARKAIPLHKALENRRSRHQHNQELSQLELLDEARADLVESSAKRGTYRIGGWRKSADEPLGDVIERALSARTSRVGRKIRARFNYSPNQ
jgi:hypothetical protein